MENYKIHKFIGEGPQSYVYLVECKKDRNNYILKKVECNDQTEASKACQEAIYLQQINHCNICVYKDVFVHWDKELTAVFLCMVMDFYELGNLDKKLNCQREKGEPMDETTIKSWFRQMLNALVYLQGKSISHMNIKPSNIFFSGNTDVILADFSGYTILTESRSIETKNATDCVKWLPPETLERSFNERYDVWSLGCILLGIMTCHIPDKTSLLSDIKSTSRCLEETIKQIKYFFTQEICEVVSIILDINHEKRPSALQLSQLPLVIEYLTSDKSPLPESKEKKNLLVDDRLFQPCPEGEGIDAVIMYMKDKFFDPFCLMNAMKSLYYFIDDRIEFNYNAKNEIRNVMLRHKHNENIQTIGCILFAKLARQAPSGDILFSRSLISPVSLAMKTYPSSIKLQIASTILFKTLAVDERAAEEIGKLGGVQDTINALRGFPNNTNLATKCCGALSTLAIHRANAKIICKEDGLRLICKTLETHLDIPELAEAACTALCVLSIEDGIIPCLANECAVKLILQCLDTHIDNDKVVCKACLALASLIEFDESSAYEVLYGDSELPGINILISAHKHYKTNEHITESFARCIAELSKYEDLRTELNLANVHKLLIDAKLKFSGKKNVLSQIENALVSMGVDTANTKGCDAVKRREIDLHLIPELL